MKRYAVQLKQEVTATMFLNAETKAEAKQLTEDIIEDCSAENFVDPDFTEEINHDYWDVKNVELA